MALPPPRKTTSLPPPRSAAAAQPPSAPRPAPAAQFPPPQPRRPLPWKLIIGSVTAVVLVAALAVSAWLLWPEALPDNAAVTQAVAAKLPDFLELTGVQSVQYDRLNEPGKILGTVRFTAKLKENLYEIDFPTRRRELDTVGALLGQNGVLYESERVKFSLVPPVMLVTRMSAGDTIEARAQLTAEKNDKEWSIKVTGGAVPVRGWTLAQLKPLFKDLPHTIAGDSATAGALADYRRDLLAAQNKVKEAREGHDANVKMWQDELRERFAEGTVYEGTPRVDNKPYPNPVRFTVEKFIGGGRIIVGKFENLLYAPDWGRLRITTTISQNGIAAKAEWVELAKTDSRQWPENSAAYPYWRWFLLERGYEPELFWSKTDTSALAFNNSIGNQRFDLKKVTRATEK